MRCGLIVGSLIGMLACSAPSAAQAPDSLPFGNGERLTFAIRAAKFGTIGHAVMSVLAPVQMRGTETMLVSMDARFGVLFMQASDANRSWIDPRRMTSVQFVKHQRRPFSSADDTVEIFPERRFWAALHGDSGSTAGGLPLDELSFIYFLRTLSLSPDSIYAFDRHYDKRRTPSMVRFVKREVVKTPAGVFNTVEVEMRLKDGVDWKEEWAVRVWISDDKCRLPVRMESSVPILGSGVMTLESAVTPTCDAESARGFAESRTPRGSHAPPRDR